MVTSASLESPFVSGNVWKKFISLDPRQDATIHKEQEVLTSLRSTVQERDLTEEEGCGDGDGDGDRDGDGVGERVEDL